MGVLLTSGRTVNQLNPGCTPHRPHGGSRERRIIRHAVQHLQRFACDTAVWAEKRDRDAQQINTFSHQTRASLMQMQQNLSSAQAAQDPEEMKKAVRDEVMAEVMAEARAASRVCHHQIVASATN